jgi:hypothetical protein
MLGTKRKRMSNKKLLMEVTAILALREVATRVAKMRTEKMKNKRGSDMK